MLIRLYFTGTRLKISTRRILFLSLTVLLIALINSCKTHKQNVITSVDKKAPNIVLLLADDLGYGELGSYGQKTIKTSFLDKLAKRGIKFTDFYAGTAVCAPSRAVLMTGKHAGHSTIRGNKGLVNGEQRRIPLRASELTIGEMLQAQGYQTAMIGKWHLSDPDDITTWATHRGFDYAVQGQWSDKKSKTKYDERYLWINGKQDSFLYDFKNHDCLDEVYTDFAVDYLSKKDNNQPFFLYMSYRVPHANEYDVRKNDLYKDLSLPEYDREYASRITLLDQQIKRLYDELDRLGLLENTLILFTSDNGPWSGKHRFKRNLHHSHETFQSAGIYKGYKRDLYEGGIRVPLIAYWKNKIKMGTTTDHPATFYDIMPTIAEVTQTDIPEQSDGISFLPELLNKPQNKHKFLYWEIHNSTSPKGFKQATRIDNWKAVRNGNQYKTELYDLDNDPEEKNDISTDHPEIVAKANKILKSQSVPSLNYKHAGGIF